VLLPFCIGFFRDEPLHPINPFIQFMIAIGKWKYKNKKREGRDLKIKKTVSEIRKKQ
jgi:hypothetical protein